MAINLARIGGFEATPTKGFDPYEESRLQAEAQRQAKKAALDEQVGALNLANLQKQIAKEAIESGNADKLKQVLIEDYKNQNKQDTVYQPDLSKISTGSQDWSKAIGATPSMNLAQKGNVTPVSGVFVSKPEGINLAQTGKSLEAQGLPSAEIQAINYRNSQTVNPNVTPDNRSIQTAPYKYDETKTAQKIAEFDPTAAQSFLTERMTKRETAEDRIARIAKEKAEEKRLNDKEKREGETQAETVRHNKATEAAAFATANNKIDVKSVSNEIKKQNAEKSKIGVIADLDSTADVIDRLIGNEYKGIASHPGLSGLTGTESISETDISQDTRNAEALRQQLIAKSAFAELQKMRDNSPTGGALGQVSDQEGRLLQNAAAALQRGQSEEQFRKNLELFRAQLRSSKKRIEEAYAKQYGDGNIVETPNPNPGSGAGQNPNPNPNPKPGQNPKPLSEKDQKALNWANENPNDTRSKDIKKRLGVEN